MEQAVSRASIAVLGQAVIDQIAAGEVLERPAHLVKELIENSIDARSREIEIEVSDGGRSVLVVDDGDGIAESELASALTRFATSKIRSADELWSLKSYGFRGEALASAAAVSQLTLTSKPFDAEKAAQIHCAFGAVGRVGVAALNQGTRIEVRDLFANTPVRLKFLRSEAGEYGQIRAVVRALALAHEKVRFRLRLRSKIDVEFHPNDFVARCQQVLGAKELYRAEGDNPEGWRAEIAFASPHEVVGQSRQIWILVQGRWVQDRGLQQAVLEAYRNLLMHGEYPQVVVRLTCPVEAVDVNVHPTKSQVKFADPATAWRLVHQTLRRGLEQAPWQGAGQPVAESGAMSSAESAAAQQAAAQRPPLKLEDLQRRWTASDSGAFDITTLKSLRVESSDIAPSESISSSASTGPGPAFWSQGQVIGQVALKYIIMQRNDAVVLIDQHAAHERVLFERLLQQWREGQLGETQDLLIPLTVQLEAEETENVLRWSDELRRLGVAIDAVGPGTIAIRSIPSLLKDSAVVEVVRKAAQAGPGVPVAGHTLESHVRELCALMACHSAVRAGQALSEQQIRELVEQMDDHPLSGFCPHGRPVSIEWALNDLDRQFGRMG